MLPKYIKAENFKSYKNETINFDQWGSPVVVIGQNGARQIIINRFNNYSYF